MTVSVMIIEEEEIAFTVGSLVKVNLFPDVMLVF